MNWYSQSIETSIETLQTRTDTGLSQQEIESRLATYGLNELVEKAGVRR